jgi:hypothetical protein
LRVPIAMRRFYKYTLCILEQLSTHKSALAPRAARVVLLSLNPGYSAEGSKAHRNPDLKEAIFRNLKGQAQQYPFYPLNPAFSWSPTARWWVPRTRELRQATGLTDLVFSERLLAIEWFPYPSKSAGLPRTKLCKSQEYTFDLAKRVSTTTFVLRMRSVNHWSAVDPRFLDVPSLNNPQCSHISRRNTEGDTFDRMVEALTAN